MSPLLAQLLVSAFIVVTLLLFSLLSVASAWSSYRRNAKIVRFRRNAPDTALCQQSKAGACNASRIFTLEKETTAVDSASPHAVSCFEGRLLPAPVIFILFVAGFVISFPGNVRGLRSLTRATILIACLISIVASLLSISVKALGDAVANKMSNVANIVVVSIFLLFLPFCWSTFRTVWPFLVSTVSQRAFLLHTHERRMFRYAMVSIVLCVLLSINGCAVAVSVVDADTVFIVASPLLFLPFFCVYSFPIASALIVMSVASQFIVALTALEEDFRTTVRSACCQADATSDAVDDDRGLVEQLTRLTRRFDDIRLLIQRMSSPIAVLGAAPLVLNICVLFVVSSFFLSGSLAANASTALILVELLLFVLDFCLMMDFLAKANACADRLEATVASALVGGRMGLGEEETLDSGRGEQLSRQASSVLDRLQRLQMSADTSLSSERSSIVFCEAAMAAAVGLHDELRGRAYARIYLFGFRVSYGLIVRYLTVVCSILLFIAQIAGLSAGARS